MISLGDMLRNNVRDYNKRSEVIIAKLAPWLHSLSKKGISEISWYYENNLLNRGYNLSSDYYNIQLMTYVRDNHEVVRSALASENIDFQYDKKDTSSIFSFEHNVVETIRIRWA